MLDFDERHRLIREAIERKDEPLEANCTGVSEDKIRIIGKVIAAEIFNEKVGHWQRVELTEYFDACPICGRFMKVRAVIGTTWLAACPEHTRQAFEELEKSRKEMSKNIPELKL